MADADDRCCSQISQRHVKKGEWCTNTTITTITNRPIPAAIFVAVSFLEKYILVWPGAQFGTSDIYRVPKETPYPAGLWLNIRASITRGGERFDDGPGP